MRTRKERTCAYLDYDDDVATDNILVASAAPAPTSTRRTAPPQAQSVPQQSLQALLEEQSQSLRRLQDELTAVRRQLALQGQQVASTSERLASYRDPQDDNNCAHHDLEITGVKGKSFKVSP